MNKKIINPLNSVKAGMRLSFHRYDIKERNIIRQDAVEAEKQIEVPALFYIHMEEVLACMNPRIRAAASVNCYALFKDPAETVLQNFLNTELVRLPLPAEVIGALIADMNKISQLECFSPLS